MRPNGIKMNAVRCPPTAAIGNIGARKNAEDALSAQ
jgi:hypothetical protein